MKIKLYSIKDKLEEFQGVLAINDEKIAKRIFESYCKKQKTEQYTDAKYYELYELGEFETKTGVINGYSKQEIKLIAEGEQFDEQRT